MDIVDQGGPRIGWVANVPERKKWDRLLLVPFQSKWIGAGGKAGHNAQD